MAALSLLVSAVALPRAYAYPLLTGLGGRDGFGVHMLHLNDDESSTEIDLSDAFPNGLRFFGGVFRSFYVNNNGNVSFGGPVRTFTPEAFPIAGQRIIAPFWSDVDTRPGGDMAVTWQLATGRVVVTWHDVGYYNHHRDRRNDFQLILRDRSDVARGAFDAEFRYNRCEWTTGDASGGQNGRGGTPAQAGFDAGDREHFAMVPGSRTDAIEGICHTSNVGTPGRWVFEIRDGRVSICGNEHVEEPDETCDDGNRRDGDGCSSRCGLEPGGAQRLPAWALPHTNTPRSAPTGP